MDNIDKIIRNSLVKHAGFLDSIKQLTDILHGLDITQLQPNLKQLPARPQLSNVNYGSELKQILPMSIASAIIGGKSPLKAFNELSNAMSDQKLPDTII